MIKLIALLSCAILLCLSPVTAIAKDEIELLFPKAVDNGTSSAFSKRANVYMVNGKEKEYNDPEELSKFVKKFKKGGYHVDQIELWIEAKAETGGVTQLFVSMEGSSGFKIILKPNRE